MLPFMKNCARPCEEDVRAVFEARELQHPHELAKDLIYSHGQGAFGEVFRTYEDDSSTLWGDKWGVQQVTRYAIPMATGTQTSGHRTETCLGNTLLGKTARIWPILCSP